MKEAMKLALEALEHCKDVIVERGLNGSPEFAKKWGLELPLERSESAIIALREALAEQPAQQEPVAWRVKWPAIGGGHKWLMVDRPLMAKEGFVNEALYTSPPAQPATEESSAVQPAQQEPVYFCDYGYEGWGKVDAAIAAENRACGMTVEAYYTSPLAQHKPLAFSKLCDIEYEITHRDGDFSILKFARAIEAAHGIMERT